MTETYTSCSKIRKGQNSENIIMVTVIIIKLSPFEGSYKEKTDRDLQETALLLDVLSYHSKLYTVYIASRLSIV